MSWDWRQFLTAVAVTFSAALLLTCCFMVGESKVHGSCGRTACEAHK